MAKPNRKERRRLLQEAYNLHHKKEESEGKQPSEPSEEKNGSSETTTPPTTKPMLASGPPGPTSQRWYESSLFWGALGPVLAIVLVVVTAMGKDLRWLLWVSWPFCGVAAWAACQGIQMAIKRWLAIGAILVAATVCLWWGYYKWEPQREVATSNLAHLQVPAGGSSGNISADATADQIQRMGGTHCVQFGTVGGILDLRYAGRPQWQFLYDAGLSIDSGNKGLEISTPVRDSSGNLVALIEHNHWTVAPRPLCWDRNYTRNSLEVLDHRGHVVLQVRLLPDRIQLQGEWRNEYGAGWRLSNGAITWWPNRDAEQRLNRLIPPMFLYPSAEHLGELAPLRHE